MVSLTPLDAAAVGLPSANVAAFISICFTLLCDDGRSGRRLLTSSPDKDLMFVVIPDAA